MTQGSLIDGRWISGGDDLLEVVSPIDDQVVFSTPIDPQHASMAIEAARRAAPAWAALSRGLMPPKQVRHGALLRSPSRRVADRWVSKIPLGHRSG